MGKPVLGKKLELQKRALIRSDRKSVTPCKKENPPSSSQVPFFFFRKRERFAIRGK